MTLRSSELLNDHGSFSGANRARALFDQLRPDHPEVGAQLGNAFTRRYSLALLGLEKNLLAEADRVKGLTGREPLDYETNPTATFSSQLNYMRNFALLSAFVRSGGTLELDLLSDNLGMDFFQLFIALQRGKKYGLARSENGFSLRRFAGEPSSAPYLQKVRDSLLLGGDHDLTPLEKKVFEIALQKSNVRLIADPTRAESLPLVTGSTGQIFIGNTLTLPRPIKPSERHLALKDGHGAYLFAGLPGITDDASLILPKISRMDNRDFVGADGEHSECVKMFSPVFLELYGDRVYRAAVSYTGGYVRLAITGLVKSFDPAVPAEFFVRENDLPKIALACRRAFGEQFSRFDLVCPFSLPLSNLL